MGIYDHNNHSMDTLKTTDTNRSELLWFALITILTVSCCVLLLRVRGMYNNHKSKQSASSLGLAPSQLTDDSILDSIGAKVISPNNSYYHHKHKDKQQTFHHFSSIKQTDEGFDVEHNKSPFSNSVSFGFDTHVCSELIPMTKVRKYKHDDSNTMSLEIEHDINTIYDAMNKNTVDEASDSREGSNVSVVATFDIKSMMIPSTIITEAHNDDDNDEESHSSFSDEPRDQRIERNISFNSMIASFDRRSFMMKADEFKYEINNEYINTLMDTEDIVSRSGETSDEQSDEIEKGEDTYITSHISSGRSAKEQKIKSNISEIMMNLTKMRKMATSD